MDYEENRTWHYFFTLIFMSTPKFSVGDKVYKSTGDYTYPGEIRSVFTKRDWKILYVVEAIWAGYEGMEHIFNESQLEFLIH